MYDRIRVKSESRQILKQSWGFLLGVLAVFAVISAVLDATQVGIIATWILSGPLSVGVSLVFLKTVRGESVNFSEMFSGFNNFGPNCLAGVLTSLFTLLWSLLFIIPGIVKAYSYSMTFYILNDRPELTAQEAIKESQRMMDGRKADLFMLDLSFILWYLLVAVTFGIAIIYVGPYIKTAKTLFYESIKDEKQTF